MIRKPTADVIVFCSKCQFQMAVLRGITPSHIPTRMYLEPCPSCEQDRNFLEEISKPVEDREGYAS